MHTVAGSHLLRAPQTIAPAHLGQIFQISQILPTYYAYYIPIILHLGNPFAKSFKYCEEKIENWIVEILSIRKAAFGVSSIICLLLILWEPGMKLIIHFSFHSVFMRQSWNFICWCRRVCQSVFLVRTRQP